jgi:hypothetical protein
MGMSRCGKMVVPCVLAGRNADDQFFGPFDGSWQLLSVQNGAFYHNGRYHLMYLYNRNGSGFCWGHVSSTVLIHWRHHPDEIRVGQTWEMAPANPY